MTDTHHATPQLMKLRIQKVIEKSDLWKYEPHLLKNFSTNMRECDARIKMPHTGRDYVNRLVDVT